MMEQKVSMNSVNLHRLAYFGDLEQISSLKLSESQLKRRDQEGCTPLHLACFNNHSELIRYLIDTGIDIHCQDNNLTTPLHWCAYNGNKEMVQLLIDKGGRQTEDTNGIQPMHLAALMGQTEILHILLSQEIINFKDKSGATPLHLAAYCGHNECIQVILDTGFIDINEEDNKKITPIYLAAMCDLVDTVLLLLKNGANCQDHHNITMCAVMNGNLELLKILLNDNDLQINWNHNGCEPCSLLFLATMYGHDEIIIYLLEKGHVILLEEGACDVYIQLTNMDGPDGVVYKNLPHLKCFPNSLYWALAYCSRFALEALITTGIDPNDLGFLNQICLSSLHVAASFGNCDGIKVLLERGIDVNLTANKYTALQWAVAHAHVDAVKLLLEHGASNSQTLCWVAAQGNVSVSKLLLENGAQIDEVDQEDEYPRTPLLWAATYGQAEMIRFLLENGADINTNDLLHWCAVHDLIDIIRLILHRGIDVNSEDIEYERTALHYAAKHGHLSAAKLLIDAGIEINKRDSNYDLPIHLAVHSNSIEMVTLLIAHGAQLNEDGNIGPPLCIAAQFGYLDLVKILVDAGADINLTDINSDSPLSLALLKRNMDIVKYLIEKGAEKSRLIHVIAEYGTLNELKEVNTLDYNIHSQDERGFSPLSYAVRKSVQNSQFLIESGANVNAKNHRGETPIYEAIRAKNIDTVELLIKNGADLNIQASVFPNGTPLIQAAIDGHLEIVKLLVENGADVNLIDGDQTALYLPHELNRLEIIKYLLSKPNINLNVHDNDGLTALHYSIINKYRIEATELLLQHGADVNAIADDNLTAISAATQHVKDYDKVKLLLLYGADLHIDKSILSNCYTEYDLEFVKLLHLAGLQLSKVDNPLSYADETEFSASLEHYILKMVCEPPTLKQLSRIACRHAFGKQYRTLITEGYLPHTLKKYLAFEILD